MADVGVLNLQIQDNSEQAAQGLDKLVGALERIKNAVSGGLKLAGISSGLQKLGKVVDENISGSTIAKIGQLADELAKLKGIGNITIKVSGVGNVTAVKDAIDQAKTSMSGINEGFEDVGRRAMASSTEVGAFNAAVHNTEQMMGSSAWKSGVDQFREVFEAWSRMRSAFSLGPGENTGLSTAVEKGWTAWKDGAIEAEGTVSDAMEGINGFLEGTQLKITGLVGETKTATSQVEELKAKVDAVRPEGWGTGSIEGLVASTGQLGEMLRGLRGISAQWKAIHEVQQATGLSESEIVRQIQEINARARTANATIKEMVATLNTPMDPKINWSQGIDGMFGIGAESKSAEESMRVFLDAMNGTAEAAQKLRADNPDLYDFKKQMDSAGVSAKEFTGKLVGVDGELKAKKEDAEQASIGIGTLRDAFRKAFPAIDNIWKRFKSIVLRRTITAMIRQVVSGFKEGIENVYQYSKAINGDFAPAMDNAASSLALMKNSVGAAAAPLIQSLIPILQTVVNWVVEVINKFNQFLALLRGQSTWTKAVPATVNAFGKEEKAARSAASAIKDLMADWDELNIIQSQTSGGGLGGSGEDAEDYLHMFEEVGEFDSKIRKIVDFIRDNFDKIKITVAAIGTGILGWKIGSALSAALGDIKGIAGGTALLSAGIVLTFDGGVKIGEGNVTETSILEAASGLIATTIGGAWIGSAAAKALFGAGAAGAGGFIGALTGLAVGLAVADYAVYLGKTNALYGDVEEDVETIRENVRSLFTIPVEASIDVVSARIGDINQAEGNVRAALTDFGKSYGIAVSVRTEESALELADRTQTLVEKTNALIEEHRTNLKVGLSIASTSFEDPDEVLAFSDQEWLKLERHVSEIGERIGDILTDGITVDEQVVLKELQEKLTAVSRALTDAEESAGFASAVTLAGSKIRNGEYSKDTLLEYMKEYTKQKELLQTTAEANATATKISLKKLAQGMEAAGLDVYTQDEIDQAWANYNAYDVAGEARKLVASWTSEGNDIFVSDMISGLMGLLNQEFSHNMLNINSDRLQSVLDVHWDNDNLAHTAELYENQLISYVAGALGIDKGVLSDMLGAMGRSIFEILPDDIRKKLQEQVGRKIELEGFKPGQLTEWEQLFGEPVKMTVTVDKDNIEDVVALIQQYLDDGVLTISEQNKIKANMGGSEPLNAAIQEMELVAESDGTFVDPSYIGPSVPDIAPYAGTAQESTSEDQLVAGVAAGMKSANESQNLLLEDIARILTRIAGKDFSVNIVPSSSYGMLNEKSAEQFARVTGG